MRSALCLLACCLPILGDVITFDDLPARSSGQIPNGYSNLNWSSGFTFFDPLSYFGSSPNGYSAGVITGPNIAYDSNAGSGNSISFSNPAPFTFNSVFLTAAWYDNLQVTVTGFQGGIPVTGDNRTVTLSATTPTLFAFNWTNVDRISFTPFGGTQHVGYAGSGVFFLMDNLDVVTTPEPGYARAVALMLIGTLFFKLLKFGSRSPVSSRSPAGQNPVGTNHHPSNC